jgi:hypothetical protein
LRHRGPDDSGAYLSLLMMTELWVREVLDK